MLQHKHKHTHKRAHIHTMHTLWKGKRRKRQSERLLEQVLGRKEEAGRAVARTSSKSEGGGRASCCASEGKCARGQAHDGTHIPAWRSTRSKPSTLNPQPSTLNPQPSTLNLIPRTQHTCIEEHKVCVIAISLAISRASSKRVATSGGAVGAGVGRGRRAWSVVAGVWVLREVEAVHSCLRIRVRMR